MTFKKRYIIILTINTLFSILAISSLPLFAYKFLRSTEYKNTGLFAPAPHHEELYARLTGNSKELQNLSKEPHILIIISQERGLIYSAGKNIIDNLEFDKAIEEVKRLENVKHRYISESYSFNGDNGIILSRLDKRSIIGTVRIYMIPISIVLIILFIIIPAIINFSLLYNLKNSFSRLETAAEEVSRGNYSINLERKNKDELYNFYQSFNRMGVTLKENRDEKSRLLMSISHDLKTPLTSMKGYIEAFNDGLVSEEKRGRYHNIIRDKTLLLEDRINSLIDFAKLETMDWVKKFETIEVSPFLMELAMAFKEDSIIYNRNFIYTIDIPDDSIIKGDPKLLMRAIENLLENSKRYTEEGGEIQFISLVEKEVLYIEISDNGRGIDSEDLNNIFKPFYKADKGRNSVGMGMGLYNVKSIIESHGGRVDCKSTLGEGSRFIITISLI